MNKVIGTCSICGGAVTLPEFWGGVIPPLGTCQKCGAIAKPNYGREIPMSRPTPTPGAPLNVVEWPDI